MSDADGLTPLLWYTHKKIHDEAELTPSDLGNVSVSLFINIMWRHNTHATQEAKIATRILAIAELVELWNTLYVLYM